MRSLENKIEGQHVDLQEVFKHKYNVDYFQREYNWGKKHIDELIKDLTDVFLSEYRADDQRTASVNYKKYFLGSFVISEKNSVRSIIDGQQRLTSLTLLLIYLNNLQKELNITLNNIESYIFSDVRGVKSFNIMVEDRIPCLEALFNRGDFNAESIDNSSVANMVERYQDIIAIFPDEIKSEKVLPIFIDWVLYNVIMIKITAYSEENAYKIFETMNDRGLSLTPSEMLKGFLLSHFTDLEKRKSADIFWQTSIMKLKKFEHNEDQKFFQAWFKAKYADTIRQGKVGSQNEDFEKIATRFHEWVRDNLSKMELISSHQKTFENFIDEEFKFYLIAYTRILEAQDRIIPGLECVFYINKWGIAPTLSFPLLLASLKRADSDGIISEKINLVARYIEIFVIRRSVNFKKFSATSIRYTMYSLVKEIRNSNIDELREILSRHLQKMPEKIAGVCELRLHGQNSRFIKFLLSRITAFIDSISGANTDFITYFEPSIGKPFEIEHILADKFERHKHEFAQEYDFNNYRNRLGGLALLPAGTNQSYSDKSYTEKVEHYTKENLLVKSLHELAYINNPNFTNGYKNWGFSFKPYAVFGKKEIDDRQRLYLEICEHIWGDV